MNGVNLARLGASLELRINNSTPCGLYTRSGNKRCVNFLGL